jgi:hypothetical protein
MNLNVSGQERHMRQLSLFDDPSAELAMLMVKIKSTMNQSASLCGLSRDQIVDRMNEIASKAGISLSRGNAKSVKTATLEKWLNPANSEHLPSLVAVNVFCMAVKNIAPLSAMLGLHGCGVMTPEDKKLRDYAEAILAERDARKRKKQLELKL